VPRPWVWILLGGKLIVATSQWFEQGIRTHHDTDQSISKDFILNLETDRCEGAAPMCAGGGISFGKAGQRNLHRNLPKVPKLFDDRQESSQFPFSLHHWGTFAGLD